MLMEWTAAVVEPRISRSEYIRVVCGTAVVLQLADILRNILGPSRHRRQRLVAGSVKAR